MANENIRYIIDWKQTFLNNIIWLPLAILIFSLCFVALNKVKFLTDQTIQLMYLIFCLFFITKLLGWLGQPQLAMYSIVKHGKRYKEEKNNSQKKMRGILNDNN